MMPLSTARIINFSESADYMADSPTLLHSLRLLNPAYAGDCITVRRSSDNTLTSIGFSGSSLNVGALLSFVGAGDGFVHTWFDQSGNANNATQTNNSLQPKIVASGVMCGEDGVNSILFSDVGSDTFLESPVPFLQSAQTIIYAAWRDSSVESQYSGILGSQRNSRMALGYDPGGSPSIQRLGINDKSFQDATASTATVSDTWSVQAWATRWGLLSNDYIDVLSTFNGGNGSTRAAGNFGGIFTKSFINSNNFKGCISDIAVYPSLLSPQARKILERDICDYVGAPFQFAAITPSNPYGVAGIKQVFALRKIIPEYSGPAITVYGGFQRYDIGFDVDGNLDLAALSVAAGVSNDVVIEVWHNQLGDGNSIGGNDLGARIAITGVIQTINGTEPTIIFADNRALEGGWGVMGQPFTYAAAFKASSTSSFHSIFSQFLSTTNMGIGWEPGGEQALMYNGVAHSVNATTVINNAAQVTTWRADAGYKSGNFTVTPTLNGPDGGSITTNFAGSVGYKNYVRHGDVFSSSDVFVGAISEIVLTDRSLDSTDRYLIQNSMGSYFGVTIT